jgi:hypothetical protein
MFRFILFISLAVCNCQLINTQTLPNFPSEDKCSYGKNRCERKHVQER